jgi:hypothetical protein
MLNDNQLSTVLLLVALGFLIYYLTKPKTVSENFANAKVNSAINQENTILPKNSQELQTKKLAGSTLLQPIPEPRVNKKGTEVQPEVLRQILNETNVKTETKKEIKEVKPIFDFEANDVFESGAELDSAFQRPIPQQARPDEIPINKNNLKKYDAKDFLPKEINSQWFDTDFSQAKYNVNDDKLINTERYVIGVNTVGQSLKNASYDIRGTIANPKFTVSPWNNSTYEPDYNIKPLC